ncbi:MAG: hypothetical protein WCL06_11180 [Bacteroidota bacterium]
MRFTILLFTPVKSKLIEELDFKNEVNMTEVNKYEDKIYIAKYGEDISKKVYEYNYIQFPDFYMSFMGKLENWMLGHHVPLSTGYFLIFDIEDRKEYKTVCQSYGDGLISMMTFTFGGKIYEFDSCVMKEISEKDIENEDWVQRDQNAKV